MLHRMVMMPMMSMPVFYMAPAPQHMNLMCILRQMFQKSQPYAKRQRSVVGELMRATMRYITTFLRHTKTLVRGVAWKRVLAIRATKLPALETCYVEKNESDYVHWGCNAIDLERVLAEFQLRLCAL